MRSSWRRPGLPAANSSRALAREATTMHAGLQCGTQRVAFVQLAVSLLRARQAEQEGCHHSRRFGRLMDVPHSVASVSALWCFSEKMTLCLSWQEQTKKK